MGRSQETFGKKEREKKKAKRKREKEEKRQAKKEEGKTSFDDMIEEADSEIVRTINSCMESLNTEEVNAIWARYLNTRKPMYYELKLMAGLEKLKEMVETRVQI